MQPETTEILKVFIGALFAGGGFYFLVNWRLKQLEEKAKHYDTMNERIIRIEEIVKHIDKKLDNEGSY